jgi:hypothetical protein
VTEKESIIEFARGQRCPKCDFKGFDYHGRAFYTDPLQWQVGCQNCGHPIRVGYNDLSKTEIVVIKPRRPPMPIEVIKPPFEFHKPAAFLGGSISSAADWQERFAKLLSEYDAVDMILLNPRRDDFDMTDQGLSDRQIDWEFRHLRRADLLVFYFSHETLAPISLLEFGAHSHSSGKPIVVGVHPEYKRRRDVEVQCRLIRPDIRIVYNLEALVDQTYAWYSEFSRSLK